MDEVQQIVAILRGHGESDQKDVLQAVAITLGFEISFHDGSGDIESNDDDDDFGIGGALV
jgi:hypothetical protein